MKLTNPEKLILVMLAELHEKVGIDSTNTKLLKNAIYSDNTWALSWEMRGIVGDHGDPTPPEVSEVVDVLGMWTLIEEAYASYDAPKQAAVQAAAKASGGAPRFAGFDGNNEAEYLGIANFLVTDMGRFAQFKGRDLNSHFPAMDGYRRMLAIWKPTRAGLGGGTVMSPDRMTELLNARRAP